MMQQAVLTKNETDDGKPKALPSRTCIVTHETKPVSELIRFVAAPDGAPVPDLKAVLPGRGVWVSASKAALQQAVKTKAFSHALKTDVTLEADLPEIVGRLMKARALQAVAMANKAGQVVCGAVKIEKAFAQRLLALIHASDGSRDGVQKLNHRFRAASGADAPVFAVFRSEDLDMALGRSNVIHAALTEGSAARACLQWLEKVTIFEGKELNSVDEQE